MGNNSKSKRDIYYRAARTAGLRARSAFKLLQLDQHFNLFSTATPETHLNIVDLCAAPGGWTEVCQLRTAQTDVSASIVAVDLQQMHPLPDVTVIHGDITAQSTANSILASLNGQLCDLVLCDGAPDVINLHHIDAYMQHQLTLSALYIACHILNSNATFICKMFRSMYSAELLSFMAQLFVEVTVTKPRACRNASIESFVVCQGYRRTQQHIDLFAHKNKYAPLTTMTHQQCVDKARQLPFVACNGGMQHVQHLSADATANLCADTTYPPSYIISDSVSDKPIQNKPIDAPYHQALQLQRVNARPSVR